MRHDMRTISGPVRSCWPRAIAAAVALLMSGAVRPLAADTIVTFVTNLGTFDVQLYDAQVPTTVGNFLQYVNAGSYSNTFFHRSTTYDPNGIQIVQGGGFGYVYPNFFAVTAGAPIPLEAGLSNLRGTIAMARTADPNSATSQWFFNVQDNPGLDPNPGLGIDGYAVFGKVVGDGMNVVDAIASLPAYLGNESILGQADGPFNELPLINGNTLVMVGSVVAVPEPTTLALALSALAGIACLRRKEAQLVDSVLP